MFSYSQIRIGGAVLVKQRLNSASDMVGDAAPFTIIFPRSLAHAVDRRGYDSIHSTVNTIAFFPINCCCCAQAMARTRHVHTRAILVDTIVVLLRGERQRWWFCIRAVCFFTSIFMLIFMFATATLSQRCVQRWVGKRVGRLVVSIRDADGDDADGRRGIGTLQLGLAGHWRVRWHNLTRMENAEAVAPDAFSAVVAEVPIGHR
mmetsp:Transcript_15641/g.43211  ORF Transcript_15641/g.43211 Transcript_15641/m.43211 type:complete len:204 (-) Transcript_15641:70-681(-)